jgi:hypothetical protein
LSHRLCDNSRFNPSPAIRPGETREHVEQALLGPITKSGFCRTFDDPGPPAESLVCSHARGVSNQRVQRNLLRPSG